MDCVVTAEPIEGDARSRARDADSRPPLPTLGEILDAIAAERPDWRVACDPRLRSRRVGQVRVVAS